MRRRGAFFIIWHYCCAVCVRNKCSCCKRYLHCSEIYKQCCKAMDGGRVSLD